MRYRLFTTILSILALGTIATAQRTPTTLIQVLNPPAKNLRISDTLNVAIIANIYNDTRSDSLKIAEFPSDSLLTVETAYALKDALQQSPLFADYNIPIYNYEQNDVKKSGLTNDEAREIGAEIQADYLLTVDVIFLEVNMETAYAFTDFEKLAYAANIVESSFAFRAYNLTMNTLEDSQMFGDTLLFESFSYELSPDAVRQAMPSANESAYEVCDLAGRAYAQLIAPYWVEEERMFYNDRSKKMEESVKFVENQEWLKAMDIWNEYTTLQDDKRAAMACYNMALGCEMIGDFELAIQWLSLAKKKNRRLETEIYEEILYKRLNDKPDIDRILNL